MNLPQHIVIIPDGNRRWAKKKGLPTFFGHRAGAKALEKILKAVLELKIPCFTFWGASIDNITKRPKQEVDFLFNVFEKYFKKLAKNKEIHQNQVRVNALGRWEKLFPEKTKESIKEAIKKTRNYKKYNLTILLAYSGIDEMEEAIRKIAISILRTSDVHNIRTSDVQKLINKESIKSNLWTKDLPPVDLVIRTGSANEPHLSSGMMMWDTADSQFYFTDTFFPDFSAAEFKKAVEKYGETERRRGA